SVEQSSTTINSHCLYVCPIQLSNASRIYLPPLWVGRTIDTKPVLFMGCQLLGRTLTVLSCQLIEDVVAWIRPCTRNQRVAEALEHMRHFDTAGPSKPQEVFINLTHDIADLPCCKDLAAAKQRAKFRALNVE